MLVYIERENSNLFLHNVGVENYFNIMLDCTKNLLSEILDIEQLELPDSLLYITTFLI